MSKEKRDKTNTHVFWFLQIGIDYSAMCMAIKYFPLAVSTLNNSRELYPGNSQNIIQIQSCSKGFQCTSRNILLPHGDYNPGTQWHLQKCLENRYYTHSHTHIIYLSLLPWTLISSICGLRFFHQFWEVLTLWFFKYCLCAIFLELQLVWYSLHLPCSLTCFVFTTLSLCITIWEFPSDLILSSSAYILLFHLSTELFISIITFYLWRFKLVLFQLCLAFFIWFIFWYFFSFYSILNFLNRLNHNYFIHSIWNFQYLNSQELKCDVIPLQSEGLNWGFIFVSSWIWVRGNYWFGAPVVPLKDPGLMEVSLFILQKA